MEEPASSASTFFFFISEWGQGAKKEYPEIRGSLFHTSSTPESLLSTPILEAGLPPSLQNILPCAVETYAI
jgi:hypothetical protein